MGILSRIMTNTVGRLAGNAAYYGVKAKYAQSQPSRKNMRIQNEYQQLYRLIKGWTWLMSNIHGRPATPETLSLFRRVDTDASKMMSDWDETKYYQTKLDAFSRRLGTLAAHFGLLEQLQNYINSLADV